MLAVSQAGSLKPEIRLQQALREYESLLTKDQRQLYNTRVRSGRAPDMADVIQATSEIDREARKQRGIHKCAAPRLMKVLTACQRFAAIGDVLIGGSQNLIACGVWSAVRLSLQVSTIKMLSSRNGSHSH
jgi:ankyrin repeat domain-containing protein 50